MVYKTKVEKDSSLRLKVQTAFQGNIDTDIQNFRSIFCMCSPTGTIVVVTVAQLRQRRIVKIDVEMALHQSGAADWKFYV